MNRKIRNSMIKLMLAAAFSFVMVIVSASTADAGSVGAGQVCVVTSTGGLKCFGNGYDGQLGNGSFFVPNFPVGDVTDLTSGVAKVSTGWIHTCALTTAGGVKCWGQNNYGQLGIGYPNPPSAVPVDVPGMESGVVDIAAGGIITCALKDNGSVSCWDRYHGGGSPVAVPGMGSGVTAITIGGDASFCALMDTDGVKCWGDNNFGQLGNGTNIGVDRSAPTDVVGLTSGVKQVSGGYVHTCALTTAGGVKCWGANNKGQLGDGTQTDSNVPVDVVGLTSGVAEVSAGGEHSCVVMTDGSAKCWGVNDNGTLGDGNGGGRSHSTVPSAVIGTGYAQIAASLGNTCALTTGGGVKCWGRGALYGDGVFYYALLAPVDVAGLASGVVLLPEHSDPPDTIAPEIDVTGPVANGMYGRGSVVAPIVSCTDEGGSGLATCNYSATLDTSSLGMKTFTVTASDNAGNTSSANVPYKVGGKNDCKNGGWALFLQPTFPNQGQCVSSFVP